MAKFSKKVMGKEVGDAKVYAEPHTMDGKAMKSSKSKVVDPNTLVATSVNPATPAMRVSAGNPDSQNVKTTCSTNGIPAPLENPTTTLLITYFINTSASTI